MAKRDKQHPNEIARRVREAVRVRAHPKLPSTHSTTDLDKWLVARKAEHKKVSMMYGAGVRDECHACVAAWPCEHVRARAVIDAAARQEHYDDDGLLLHAFWKGALESITCSLCAALAALTAEDTP